MAKLAKLFVLTEKLGKARQRQSVIADMKVSVLNDIIKGL